MSRAVLLLLVAMAGCQGPDDWTVLSLDTVKVEDLLPSSRKVPDLTALVNQKIRDVFDEFVPPEDLYRGMRDIEPSLEHASDFKLRMLIHLLRLPHRRPTSPSL